MVQSMDIKKDLADFFTNNLFFYTNEWMEYLKKNKSYLVSVMAEIGEIKLIEEIGNPLMRMVADSLIAIDEEKVNEHIKELSTTHAKLEFPIHMSWELFQSSRGIIWNAVKAFYMESKIELDRETYFALERLINDTVDVFIETYTKHYVSYKDTLLQSHRETVDELSVPIIPITNKVCILPIVGDVDTYRAKKIRERTLFRINELKAQQLIIDISGVPYVDTAVVNHLFKIVQGIKLVGCSTILTGISPEIADTMIDLGITIPKELQTKSNLQQALLS